MGGLTDAIASSAQSLSKIIGTSAPVLASVLGTPLAGIGLGLLAHCFGADSQKIEDIAQKITADPEAALKLKTLEYEHAEALLRMASQDYTTEVDDRKNARENSEIYKDFLRHFAYLITAGFFGSLIVMFFPLELTDAQSKLLWLLLGMLSSKWQTIIDFFYGSSHQQGALK